MPAHFNFPEWSKNQSLYEVNLRQYTPGGTIKEFCEHLPGLRDLGFHLLWFMPVQPIGEANRKGTLGSCYSIRDYRSVNPDHGSLDDFREMVAKIHGLGMRVILDWVANHTAWDHEWTKTHPHFYVKDQQGSFTPPNPDWTDVIQLNYAEPGLREEMIGAMKFWITETGIDGFRCDMAHLVPLDFWRKARAALGVVKPVFMLAESDDKRLLQSAFDTIYNWELYHAMNDLARNNLAVSGFREMLRERSGGLASSLHELLFISNHDENSWQGPESERLGRAVEAFTVLVYTLPGMPLVYNGQEAAFNRRLSFFDKDHIDWKENKIALLFKKLNELKRRNPSLWHGPEGGTFSILENPLSDQVFAYRRTKNNHCLKVLLNLSGDEVVSPADIINEEVLHSRDVMTGEIMPLPCPSFSMAPYTFRIFENTGPDS
jgi:glycosidase